MSKSALSGYSYASGTLPLAIHSLAAQPRNSSSLSLYTSKIIKCICLHIVDHERCLCFDDKDLEIVDGLSNIRREMSFKLVVLINL